MVEAKEENKRKVNLFGSDNFRSWILYFMPGDGTDMHYHASPETFLVLEGKASVKGIDGEEKIIGKNEVVFFAARPSATSSTGTRRRAASTSSRSRARGRSSAATEPSGFLNPATSCSRKT